MVSTNTPRFWDDQLAYQVDNIGTWDSSEQDVLERGIAFFGDVRTKHILDVGCGLGHYSIMLARVGANVTAVDTSNVAIDNLNRYATELGLSIKGIVSDALSIKDLEKFDFVVGSMILHHLEPFDEFCDSLFTAMKPGGRAIFYENNAASRLLVWFRQNMVGKMWIPKYGDPDEFPLTPREVDILRCRFRVTQIFPELLLFRLVSWYLLKGRGAKCLKTLDDLFYRHNIFVKYSYRQILLIEKPK
jgi:SAM-dependent methyltransferase